jgi:hyaluronoglucosaminidase
MNKREANKGFEYRGVVEGFYGPAYSQADRLWLIDRMASWGMNTYVHAPKDDAFGREAWRDPYPEAACDDFRALIERGAAQGVRVGFALSPGLSISYASEADRNTLVGKFQAFVDLGARFFCLALDDVSSELEHAADRERFASLGVAHADLAAHVLAALSADATLWFVPTDYAGCETSSYLEDLAASLPARIEVGWTGRTVVSPTIRGDEAKRRADVLGRRLLVWDNVPVNDGPMRRALHIGPYVGRDSHLPESVSGMLLNPMQHPRASAIALAAGAAYLRAPADYDPEAAWQNAVRACAPEAADAFALFAEAHRFSALTPDDRDRPLEQAFAAVRNAFEVGNPEARRKSVSELVRHLEARTAAPDEIEGQLGDPRLLEEIAPWLAAHRVETRRMTLACDFLKVLAGEHPALDRALAFFTLQGRLGYLETPNAISYGPRRALYPQLVSHANTGARFGADPVLFLDQNLAEEIVRFAEQQGLAQLSDDA